ARAATTTWNDGGLDQLWNTSGNWSSGTPTISVDAILPTPIPFAASTITLSNSPAASALSLTINDNYTLSGGLLNLGGTGPITVASGKSATINSPISSGGLTFNGGT